RNQAARDWVEHFQGGPAAGDDRGWNGALHRYPRVAGNARILVGREPGDRQHSDLWRSRSRAVSPRYLLALFPRISDVYRAHRMRRLLSGRWAVGTCRSIRWAAMDLRREPGT